MHVNRGLVFWGVALITAGAVALAIQFEAIPPEAAREAWRLWPVVLIIIGIAVIAARSPFAVVTTLIAGLVVGGLAGTLVAGVPDGIGLGCGGEVTDRVTADGSFGSSATIELDLNCGELNVSTQEGDGWTVDAGYAGGAEPDIEASADGLRVRSDDGGFVFGFAERRQAWDVTLPTGPELALTVDANAASTSLDLTDASLSRLEIDANAGDLDMDLSGAEVATFELDANAGSVVIEADDDTSATGSVSLNAGSLEVCLPDDLAVTITLDDPNVTFSHNLDERGFTQQGDVWRRGEGTAAIALEVDGNAANLAVDPDGGCS